MKNNSNTQEKSLQNTDSQEVKGKIKINKESVIVADTETTLEEIERIQEDRDFSDLVERDSEGESAETKKRKKSILEKRAKDFIRVGDDYYKFVLKSNKKGEYYSDKIKL